MMAREEWHVAIVESLVESPEHFDVTLAGGRSTRLSKSHSHCRDILGWLSMSVQRHNPFAICLSDDNQVAQAGMIDCNIVTEITDSKRFPHAIEVWFGGHNAPVYLPRSGPRNQEMLEHLTRSMATERPIWHVLQGSTIVDLKALTDEESEALCQWFQEQRLAKRR